ncbi:MAG: MerR family transcriptional regulator [Halobacteria archaeon]|nr:MerR family transcriptional regulator [Halobacteria archaeon]
MTANPGAEQKYRIGTVARLTGISPDTLRVWERRYAVVEPLRSAGGGREYTREHIERLQLIKQLVDAGDAIGSIAGLDTATLKDRSSGNFGSAPAAGKAVSEPCRIIAVGETIAARLQAEIESLDGIELLAACTDMESCVQAHPAATVDVMVIEIPTVHTDTTRQIIKWMEDAGAQKALIVYRFAASDALQRLPAARIQTVRAPVTPVVVRNLCRGMRPQHAEVDRSHERAGTSLTVSPRRYSNETLSRLAQVSPAMKCECPRHLAELITDLVAFERYSAECENRNSKDAALHAYLHATTSQARDLIENALAHVIEVEGIEIHE